MEVDFAVLADGVAQRPDGKLDLFGAAFDNITAGAVPAMHPTLTLAMRILVSRHEAQNQHTLDVILMGADGGEITRARADINPIPQEQLDQAPAGRSIGVGTVLQFANIVFPAYGLYHFAILWDGNEARTPIALSVSQTQ